MGKFKIGESVLIRTDLVVGQLYGTNNKVPRVYFTEQMAIYKGKKLLIVGKDDTDYTCSYKGEVLYWIFVSEMFENTEWE